ncbi:hypothetical protein [Williamsia sp.]|uniref:hypothetical protein n=1 Tax=Williamsia sp. TaxID=1872085 RepID=UPI001A1AA4E7|nr:hypothetical protein [Williamsia sp.]MBJ7289756.1 ParB N-terminal domain-containing protein [Williamsia sp.]
MTLTSLERQRSRSSHRRTVAGLSSAQTFVGCTGNTAASGSDSELDRVFARSGDELRAGRFSAGYLVPLDELPSELELVPVAKCGGMRTITTSDFAKGRSPEDVAWAVKAMYEEVLPRVAQKGDAERLLQEFDNRQGRTGFRSMTSAYRWFFGDMAITTDIADDGTLLIVNGAHRLWAARRMGITHVPARVFRLS